MNRPVPAISIRATRLATLAGLVAVLFTGCGDSSGGEEQSVTPYPVTGQVILPDGTPLTEGLVTFVPIGESGRQATGKIKADGTFALTTVNEGDGAGPGEYLVRIISTLGKPGPRRSSVSLVPTKYSDEGSSGLTVTVKPETNTLEPFKLDDRKTARRSPGVDRD